jgi:hypothetical protein
MKKTWHVGAEHASIVHGQFIFNWLYLIASKLGVRPTVSITAAVTLGLVGASSAKHRQ